MTKKELIKELRSNKKLFAYVAYNSDDGIYCQLVKSDFLNTILQMDDNVDFSNVQISQNHIYIN